MLSMCVCVCGVGNFERLFSSMLLMGLINSNGHFKTQNAHYTFVKNIFFVHAIERVSEGDEEKQ